MDNISSLELQTFTDEPVASFQINVFNQSWWQRVTKQPKSRTFIIYRTRVVNMGRAAALAFKMPDLTGDVATLHDLTGLALPLINSHRSDIVRLIACCIHNRADEPPKSLIRFLDVNMHAEMMSEVLAICLWNSGLQSFLSATMLIKGTSANFASDTDAEPATTPETNL